MREAAFAFALLDPVPAFSISWGSWCLGVLRLLPWAVCVHIHVSKSWLSGEVGVYLVVDSQVERLSETCKR